MAKGRTCARVKDKRVVYELSTFVSGLVPRVLDLYAIHLRRTSLVELGARSARRCSRCYGSGRGGGIRACTDGLLRGYTRYETTQAWYKYECNAPAVLPLDAAFAPPPDACFSRSTSVFHFLTISFARSATRLEACCLSFPTAKPALLSCKPLICIYVMLLVNGETYPEKGLGDLRLLLEGVEDTHDILVAVTSENATERGGHRKIGTHLIGRRATQRLYERLQLRGGHVRCSLLLQSRFLTRSETIQRLTERSVRQIRRCRRLRCMWFSAKSNASTALLHASGV